MIRIVARKITNPKEGVSVKISPPNAIKIIKICLKTHRTFSSEVNVAVEEYAEKKIVEYRDNGK